MTPLRLFVTFVTTLACTSTISVATARAQVVFPVGLPAGSQYQIAFVTSAQATIGSDTDLAIFNSFVSNLASQNADLPVNVTWSAILGVGSRTVLVQTGVNPDTGEPIFQFQTVPGVSRQSNSPTYSNIPIYNTLGERVVDDGSAFWNAVAFGSFSWENPIWGDESGNKVVPVSNFSNVLDGTLGWSQMGGQWFMNNAYLGMSSASRFGADEIGFLSSQSFSTRIRALSSPITVVPEPSTYAMALAGIACGGYSMWRRRMRA